MKQQLRGTEGRRMATVHSPVYLESTPFWVTHISLDSSDHQRMTQLEGKNVGQSPWTSLSNKFSQHGVWVGIYPFTGIKLPKSQSLQLSYLQFIKWGTRVEEDWALLASRPRFLLPISDMWILDKMNKVLKNNLAYLGHQEAYVQPASLMLGWAPFQPPKKSALNTFNAPKWLQLSGSCHSSGSIKRMKTGLARWR